MKTLIILLLGALPAWGQETLDFTAQNIPEVGTLSGDVVLSEFLPTNGTVTVDPLSWNFQSPLGMLHTIANPGLGIAESESMSFTTTNGAITAWNVVLAGSAVFEPPFVSESATLTNTETSYSGQISEGSVRNCGLIGPCNTLNGTGGAGAWSVSSPLHAPELDASGAFSALTLCIGFALVVTGRRSRASK
jgi:hypothetical protein